MRQLGLPARGNTARFVARCCGVMLGLASLLHATDLRAETYPPFGRGGWGGFGGFGGMMTSAVSVTTGPGGVSVNIANVGASASFYGGGGGGRPYGHGWGAGFGGVPGFAGGAIYAGFSVNSLSVNVNAGGWPFGGGSTVNIVNIATSNVGWFPGWPGPQGPRGHGPRHPRTDTGGSGSDGGSADGGAGGDAGGDGGGGY